jgi:hypothetical protein
MPLVNTAENTEFKTGTATGVAPTTHAGPSPAVERAVRLGHPSKSLCLRVLFFSISQLTYILSSLWPAHCSCYCRGRFNP